MKYATLRTTVLGVFVENYSWYKLQFPTSDTHGYTREITHITDVPEKSERLFIFDNSITNAYGIHGSLSWQIMVSDGKPMVLKHGNVGRRLVLTYYVPFRYVIIKWFKKFLKPFKNWTV